MAGSMITITACATAVCMMNGLPISINTVVPFIATLGIAMVASPGACLLYTSDVYKRQLLTCLIL